MTDETKEVIGDGTKRIGKCIVDIAVAGAKIAAFSILSFMVGKAIKDGSQTAVDKGGQILNVVANMARQLGDDDDDD